MDDKTLSEVPARWLGLPVIATVARILCRELTLPNEYLRLENKILRSKSRGRVRLTDDERRSLTGAALAMGRKLMEAVVNIVKPATILAWQRRLEREVGLLGEKEAAAWQAQDPKQHRGSGLPTGPREYLGL